MREHYDKIRAAGADVVAIGTGDAGYAGRFVEEERIPFPVFVDDAAEAATAAAVHKVNFLSLLLNPRSMPGAVRAHRAGFRIHKSGRRVTQLGATFVVGPGPVVRYAHVDAHSADHAPLIEVLAALTR